MHFFISQVIIAQIVCYFGETQFKLDFFPEVPKPNLWQYIWLTSLVPGLAGYLSLARNTLSLLKMYYYGTVLLGFGPILTTMVLNATDLLDYARNKKSANDFHGFPVIVLWFIYLFVVIQIQALGLFHGRGLLQAWARDQKKRR
jgi:hypothetical protein